MVRAIRADGGTAAEHVFYALYSLVLLLGTALSVLLIGALARRLAGSHGEHVVAVALAAFASVALIADIVAFAVLGLHPFSRLTWAAIASEDIRRLPAWPIATAAGVIVVALGVSQGLWRIANKPWASAAWQRAEQRLPSRLGIYFAAGLLTFLALDRADAERVVPRAALPFYSLWLAPHRSLPEARPAFPASTTTETPAVAFARRPDIVILMADSFRWDVLTPPVMPFLSGLTTSCASAPRHYAGGHLTQFGTFSLLYGLDGYAFLPFMQEGRASGPLGALARAGYRLEGYDAAGVAGYAIPPMQRSQFARFETITQDSVVIGRLLASLGVADGTPRFLFGFLRSMHAGYTYPPAWNRFPTGDQSQLRPQARLFNHYRNSAGYVDSLVARVYRVLAPRLASGDAILVVTGDHGEEFWEHGLAGHAAVRFDDVRTRVPLVACFAGAERMRPALSSHADVMPTLFDWMGAAGWDSTRITGRSLLRPPSYGAVSVSGAGFPSQGGAFALVTPTHKFWMHLTGPSLDAMAIDRVADTLDVTIPLSVVAKQDYERARAIYLRRQRAVLRVD